MKLESQIWCPEEGLGPVGAGPSVFDADPAAVDAGLTDCGSGQILCRRPAPQVPLLLAQVWVPWRRSHCCWRRSRLLGLGPIDCGSDLGPLAQVPLIVARVRFCAGDLLRKTAICAMQWRRSCHYFRTSARERVTCANNSRTSAERRETSANSRASAERTGDQRHKEGNPLHQEGGPSQQGGDFVLKEQWPAPKERWPTPKGG